MSRRRREVQHRATQRSQGLPATRRGAAIGALRVSLIDQVGDSGSGVTLQLRRYVAVDVQRDRYGRVPQPVLDDLGGDASLKGERGPGVPQVVQPDLWEARGPDL